MVFPSFYFANLIIHDLKKELLYKNKSLFEEDKMYTDVIKLKPNSELRKDAREQLKGNWGMAILACFFYSLILIASSVSFIGPLLLGGPMLLGLTIFFINLKRQEKAKLENLFDGFNNFAPSLVLFLLITIFTFLWSMLFVIPGIVAALRYSMSFYILNDNRNLSRKESLEESKKMMRSQKG